MTAQRVEAGQGWQWLVEGWRLFLKAPGIWIIMLLIYVAIGFLLSLIPLLGGIAEALVTPALTGGMIYGAAALSAGKELEIQHLFRAFQDKERLGPMLTLGALLLLGYIVIGLLVGGFLVSWTMGNGIMPESMLEMDQETLTRMLLGGGAFAILVVLVLGALVTMAMFYAIPLVMLVGRAPLQALQDSLRACFINIVPFLIFGLVYIVLMFLAIIPFGLGFLVLGPVTFGAVYASYRDVFAGQQSIQEPLSPSPPPQS